MRRPAFWHLFLLAALLWGGEYLRRDLWEPDEARYAYVAREMAQDGHWLVPFRSGEYYAHKPPLLFWTINLASRATGLPIGRMPVRLPGFFAGILVLWATARLGATLGGRKSGLAGGADALHHLSVLARNRIRPDGRARSSAGRRPRWLCCF